MLTDAIAAFALDHEAAKSERLNIRVAPGVKATLEKAAILEGCSLSDFVTMKAVEAARQSITDHERIVLAEHERTMFFAALLNPPTPSAKARAAARRYREMFRAK